MSNGKKSAWTEIVDLMTKGKAPFVDGPPKKKKKKKKKPKIQTVSSGIVKKLTSTHRNVRDIK